MASSCKKTLTYYKYSKTQAVTAVDNLEKMPGLAPAPTKPMADIVFDLDNRLDREIQNRNPVDVPTCNPECDFLDERKVVDKVHNRTLSVIWNETFELRDGDGNIIRGTARYRATGTGKVRTRKFERDCDEKFGEPNEAWKSARYDPAKVNVQLHGESNLRHLWEITPKLERAGLEFVEGGDSKKK